MKLRSSVVDEKLCQYELARDGKMTTCARGAVYKYGMKYLCSECAEVVISFGFKESLKKIKK